MIHLLVIQPAQHRLHLTAFSAVRGGHLVEKMISSRLVLFKSAAGEPHRWAAETPGNLVQELLLNEWRVTFSALRLRKGFLHESFVLLYAHLPASLLFVRLQSETGDG